jgi:hypothetical protein
VVPAAATVSKAAAWAAARPTSRAGTIKEQSVLHILRTAPYAIARLEFFDKRLMMSPQLRLDTSYLRNYDGEVSRTLVSPEPRLSVALQVLPRLPDAKSGHRRL